MSYKAPFQVVVREKPFNLSREQITFESGNLFEQTYLLKSPGGLSGNNNILKVDRHPGSFSIIVDYLSGYDIFPLSDEECFKAGMDRDRLLRYLVSDAIYYSLPVLGDRTKKEIIRLRAEEIRTGKQNTEAAMEVAKLQMEVEKLRLDVERANLKDKLEHEIKIIQLQHEHAKYFKRLDMLIERSRAIKDVDITTAILSPANSPAFAAVSQYVFIVKFVTKPAPAAHRTPPIKVNSSTTFNPVSKRCSSSPLDHSDGPKAGIHPLRPSIETCSGLFSAISIWPATTYCAQGVMFEHVLTVSSKHSVC